MTTQLPAPATRQAQPPVTTIFPPYFPDIVDLELQKILDRDFPALVIDRNNTWLNLYERKTINTPPFTDFQIPTVSPMPTPRTVRTLTRAILLRDSLIDFFLGRLQLAEDDTYGLFTDPSSVDDSAHIEGLNQKQIQDIYAQVAQWLIRAYNESLLTYWNVVEADGKARRALFIEEHAQALHMEAQVGVEQGSLTSLQGAMLETMLRYSRDGSPDPLRQHGVYSLSLNQPGKPPQDFAGSFVLSHVCNMGNPSIDDARLGPVVLYTPNNGLEGFASFPLLTESLTRRLADPVQRDWLLNNTEFKYATFDVRPVGEDVTPPWSYIPMSGNFLSTQLVWRRIKQQSDFVYCVDLAKARALDCPGFLKLLSQMLDPRYQFDNYLSLDRNEKNIIHAAMPDWWQAMNVEEKNDWLTSAKTFGGSIVELQQLTQDQLNTPEFNSDLLLNEHIDSVLKNFLSEKNIRLTPDTIYVDINYFTELPMPALPGQTEREAGNTLTKRYTLKSLAVEQPQILKPGYSRDIVVTDANNIRIRGLDANAVRDLVARINIEETFDGFLVARLKTSAYARTLLEKSTRLALTQMRMGLLVARQKGFESAGLDWITAVLDAPDATTRRPVKSKNIQLKFLKISNVLLSNVMLIAPADTAETGAFVLCTLNAPDGIVFRWFRSLERLKSNFLTQSALREYLLLQIPIAQRPVAQRSLEVDAWLKHYRFPAFFKYLPQPVPLPAILWDVVTFVEPSKNFLAENHDIRIGHMISDAKAYLVNSRNIESSDHSAKVHLAISIAILFLPAPVMIPLALGLGLYTAWEGFRKVDENDYKGAAEELLIALSYLVTAGIGKLSLPTKLVSPIKVTRPAPPIVRRIGPDGEEHIGFLLSPNSPPQLGTSARVTAFDPEKFSITEIDDEVFYVHNRFNLFGHSRLYRQTPDDPGLLVHSGEFGLRTTKACGSELHIRPGAPLRSFSVVRVANWMG